MGREVVGGHSTSQNDGERNAASPFDITFVIPTYNRRSLLEAEVNRIRALTKVAEVMIIDDGSEDGTFAFLTGIFHDNDQVRLIRNATNSGSAHCWNIGLANSKTNSVCFLHDDATELLPSAEQFVQTLAALMARYEIVGVHVVEEEHYRIPFQGVARDILYQLLYALAGQIISKNYGARKQCWFVAGILGVRTKIGLSLGFDDNLLKGYGFREESDFELRARRSGCRIVYDPAISVVHKRNQGGGQLQKIVGERYAFWAIRNQFIFMRKNHLRIWAPRFVLFVLYQVMLHGARPKVITDGIRDGTRALLQVEVPRHDLLQ